MITLEEQRAIAAEERLRGVILHELRKSGPLGLSAEELAERVGGDCTPGKIVIASAVLVGEGSATWNKAMLQLAGGRK